MGAHTLIASKWHGKVMQRLSKSHTEGHHRVDARFHQEGSRSKYLADMTEARIAILIRPDFCFGAAKAEE